MALRSGMKTIALTLNNSLDDDKILCKIIKNCTQYCFIPSFPTLIVHCSNVWIILCVGEVFYTKFRKTRNALKSIKISMARVIDVQLYV